MVLLLLTMRRLGAPNAASPGMLPLRQSKLTQSPMYLQNKGIEVGRSLGGYQCVIRLQKDQGPSRLYHVHLAPLQQKPIFVLILSFYVITLFIISIWEQNAQNLPNHILFTVNIALYPIKSLASNILLYG